MHIAYTVRETWRYWRRIGDSARLCDNSGIPQSRGHVLVTWDKKMGTMFGERVRQERERQRLSLRDMERLTGITFSHLATIERGVKDASLTRALMIASALNVSIVDLTTPTPPAPAAAPRPPDDPPRDSRGKW